MNIYFGGSISGGRNYLETYQEIVAHLKSLGHHVLTDHVVQDNVLELENQFTAEEIYNRDIQWIENCDCLIAEVSNPSLGVGYEIAYALNINKPVLCLYLKGIFLTRMLQGNHRDGFTLDDYETEEDWKQSIQDFLDE